MYTKVNPIFIVYSQLRFCKKIHLLPFIGSRMKCGPPFHETPYYYEFESRDTIKCLILVHLVRLWTPHA